jgi:hypothetical protein
VPDDHSWPWNLNEAAYWLLGWDKHAQWRQAVSANLRRMLPDQDPYERHCDLTFYAERWIEMEFVDLLIDGNYRVTSIRDGEVTEVPLTQIPPNHLHVNLFDGCIVAASAASIMEWPFVAVRPQATRSAGGCAPGAPLRSPSNKVKLEAVGHLRIWRIGESRWPVGLWGGF